jgi:hypothetical protein
MESVIQCGLFKATNSGMNCFYQPSNAEECSQQRELPLTDVLQILWTIFRRENINMPFIHDITDAMYIDTADHPRLTAAMRALHEERHILFRARPERACQSKQICFVRRSDSSTIEVSLKLVQAVTRLAFIPEVPSSTLGRGTDFPE